jgi:hypothetical protein
VRRESLALSPNFGPIDVRDQGERPHGQRPGQGMHLHRLRAPPQGRPPARARRFPRGLANQSVIPTTNPNNPDT